MKTRITVSGNNVTVERDDPFSGERTTTTYFAPHNGGYVRIRDAAGRYPQVCDRLNSTGDTLSVLSADKLPALIRRELKRRAGYDRRILSGR